RELVAEDVLFSYNRQRSREPGFVNASYLEGILKLEAPDKYTVKITLEKPAADFLVNIAAPQSFIIAREVVEQKGDLKEGPMIGSGRLVMEKVDGNGTDVAKRNPDYFLKGIPHVDRYEYTRIADNQSVINAFRSGDLEVIAAGSAATNDDIEALKRTNPGL